MSADQCLGELLRRESYSVYHAADYHGALAPLYLLPDPGQASLTGVNRTGSNSTKQQQQQQHQGHRHSSPRVVMVLTLHNAEYQGVFEFPDNDDSDDGDDGFSDDGDGEGDGADGADVEAGTAAAARTAVAASRIPKLPKGCQGGAALQRLLHIFRIHPTTYSRYVSHR